MISADWPGFFEKNFERASLGPRYQEMFQPLLCDCQTEWSVKVKSVSNVLLKNNLALWA
jgi:hypothetical protein